MVTQETSQKLKKKKDVKFHIERTHNIAERIY